jgi:hypothetical protein
MKTKSKEAADGWKSLRGRAQQLNRTLGAAMSNASAGATGNGGDASMLLSRADITVMQVMGRAGPGRAGPGRAEARDAMRSDAAAPAGPPPLPSWATGLLLRLAAAARRPDAPG